MARNPDEPPWPDIFYVLVIKLGKLFQVFLLKIVVNYSGEKSRRPIYRYLIVPSANCFRWMFCISIHPKLQSKWNNITDFFPPYSSLPNYLSTTAISQTSFIALWKSEEVTSTTRHSEYVLWTKPLSHSKCQKCKRIMNRHPKTVYFFLNKNRITTFNNIRNIAGEILGIFIHGK